MAASPRGTITAEVPRVMLRRTYVTSPQARTRAVVGRRRKMATAQIRLGALSADEKLASSTYKTWRQPAGDVYVTHRAMGGGFKISMHASGLWKLEERRAT